LRTLVFLLGADITTLNVIRFLQPSSRLNLAISQFFRCEFDFLQRAGRLGFLNENGAVAVYFAL
jgi:hypothetical protein